MEFDQDKSKKLEAEKVREKVNLRLSDLVPFIGASRYSIRNNNLDGEFGPMYSEGRIAQAVVTYLALVVYNSAITASVFYGTWKGISALTEKILE